MGLLDPVPMSSGGDPAAAAHKAAQSLESMMLREMLNASGAFKSSGVAGSSVRSDLFVGALADAVAKSGQLGLTKQLETAMAPKVKNPSPETTAPLSASSILSGVSEGVSSPYGQRHDPFDGHLATHHGIDLPAPEGTVVHAAMGGKVVRAQEERGYGKVVEIDHGNGESTLYAHASNLLVQKGDTISEGAPIATVGHSGRATGDHLHFELRLKGHAVDPTSALKVYRKGSDNPSERPP